jgi:hypothetical protein
MPLKAGKFLSLPLHTSLLVLVLSITQMALLMRQILLPLFNLVLNCNFIYIYIYMNVSYERFGFDLIGGRCLIRLYCLYQLLV